MAGLLSAPMTTIFSQQAPSGMENGALNFTNFSSDIQADISELTQFSTAQSHPEYGILPFNAPCEDCIELIEKRTQFTRSFLTTGNEGKEIKTQTGYSPLHYKNAQGQWITYNPKISELAPGVYGNVNDFYKIQINTNSGYVEFQNLTENRNPLVLHKDLAIEKLDQSGAVSQTIAANWSNFTVGDDGVRIVNIFPNVNLEIQVYRDKIKSNFVVLSDIGDFQIKESPNASNYGNLDKTQSSFHTQDFYENNDLAYQVGDIKIFGKDQKRQFVQGSYLASNGNVYYQWSQSEYDNLTYPIVIDPTVTSAGTLPQALIVGAGDFTNNGAFTSGCLYNLAVATPANCQITDIDWTFTYLAQNGATMSEGACRFNYAGCVSPAGVGFFWFCNDNINGGTCAGTNISIMADFAACIPAPACAPYNMNFQMEFFDAFGMFNALNCDPTFISAAQDWTMTITGETVDEPAPPTSSAGNTICEGSSTNLTATAAFGVPPYVVSWDNGAGVGNPVSVSPTTTTTYTNTITDACGITATNNITINVTPAPDAGIDAVVSYCATDPVASLLAELGGTPDATGTWAGPSALTGGSTGNFDPATMAAGVYTYTVTGAAPCVDVMATVTVSFNPLPDAGTNGATSFCLADPTADLFGFLNGTPDLGGTWSPAMASGTGVFNPAVDAGGTYTYTVTNGCGNAMADVVVTIDPNPDPGTNGALNICVTDPATDLFNELGGTPDATGTWSPALTSGTGVFDPAVDAGGTYTYSVTNGCGTLTADVVVTLVNAPDAGTNGAIAFCPTDPAADLFASLGGTPDLGGVWSPALTSGTGVFDPAVDAGGTYTYTVTASCGVAVADVVVTLNPAPDAGTNGATAFCPTDPAADLFASLVGTPDLGGVWSPALTSGTGVFDPAVDAAGTYTYTVTNGCGNAAADVVVTINGNPSPGTNGAVAFCSSDAPADLFASLGGTPDVGGTWSPALTSGTGVFDPAVDAAGTYTYSVNSCAGAPLTADVVVTLNPAPNAGVDGAVTFCDDDPLADLFASLGGTPDAGGTWSPALISGTGNFDPASDPAGTYTYTVTNPCGSVSADVVVTVNACAPPAAGFTISDTLICFGECIQFTDTSSFSPTSWEWNFGGAADPDTSILQNPSICPDTIGVFTISLTATNANGNTTATSSVTIVVQPTLTAFPDTTINMNTDAFISATADPTGGDFSWDNDDLDCPTCQSNYASPILDTEYIVDYITPEGCRATDTMVVTVLFEDIVDLPNGFSPNSDGKNDILLVKGEGIVAMNLVIHNRYGQQVFKSDSQDVGWDGTFKGKSENPGVFAWYLEYTLIDGSTNLKKGNVTLIK